MRFVGAKNFGSEASDGAASPVTIPLHCLDVWGMCVGAKDIHLYVLVPLWDHKSWRKSRHFGLNFLLSLITLFSSSNRFLAMDAMSFQSVVPSEYQGNGAVPGTQRGNIPQPVITPLRLPALEPEPVVEGGGLEGENTSTNAHTHNTGEKRERERRGKDTCSP